MKNKDYPLYDTLRQITDLKDMVYSHAEELADKTAFSWNEGKEVKSKSFADFKNDTEAFGTWLYSKNYKDVHIAVIGENSYEWIVAFMSAANGGDVAVALDKELPDDKVKELIEQGECSVVFASGKNFKGLIGENKQEESAAVCTEVPIGGKIVDVYSLDDVEDFISTGKTLLSGGDTEYKDYKIDPEKMAALFFTSGTTGKSKGVMLSQKNMAADINAACKNFFLEGETTLAPLPFHHAFGLITAVFMVFNYGKLVFINRSLKQIQKELKQVKPDMMFLVPLFVETFYKLIRQAVRKKKKEKVLSVASGVSNMLLAVGIDKRNDIFKEVREGLGGNLKVIISGGAHLDEKYVKAFRTFGVDILCGYGITECSPVLSVNRNHYFCDGSVGLPLKGCEVKIADDGEIITRGDNVMMGYYKDKESTDAVFENGWFKTGDLGCKNDNGFLFITGRKKNLVILSNGENVSPEEIEDRLLKHEEIAEIIVSGENGQLIAEIFPAEGHMGDQAFFDAIIDKENEKQPQYKKIRKVILRDTEFEKNSTKKIIRYKKDQA